MRYFNTSGPNIPSQHYTLYRRELIAEGIEMVEQSRYFTIWAPRQTGKSTYFLQLAYYAKSLGLTEGIYLVFVNHKVVHNELFSETQEVMEDILIKTFLVFYDEEKDF